MTAKIQKDPVRKIVIAARITKAEYKIIKKFCKENKITQSRMMRYSIDETLKNNLVPTMPE